MRGDLFRDLVTLEHVLERGDLEAHLIGQADQHQDLVSAVAVCVHEPFPFEDLDQRFELQVAPGRQHVLAGRSSPRRNPSTPFDTPSRA